MMRFLIANSIIADIRDNFDLFDVTLPTLLFYVDDMACNFISEIWLLNG